MVASEQKKRASQGKPHFLRKLNHFKLSNHDQNMLTREALLYIAMLKLKIEALQKEPEVFKEVKVEKLGEGFQVKIKSLKGDDKLVNILQAFEDLGLSVTQARASCRDTFAMEANVVPQSKDKMWSVDDITHILVKALVKPSGPV
ncbi:hypothetical protein EUTSA_v10009779mg [Eutrema salsugineum]|uniref:Plant bHLH transcription factor ACT-like domain-containing protein n=1 Tax=Eutrema salsugineum TaxID=72664 RepID=V4MQH3_EUTSA|nr:uncharacterized protein LOC18992165 [Eutrema salsugineum]ESQ33946.1 hypothetical protein EUTSA_v10009779mg [Eutrema salsugineum]